VTSWQFQTMPRASGPKRSCSAFNHVFLSHDPAALRDLIADDCILEKRSRRPMARAHEGKDACIALWTQIATTEGIDFEPKASLRAAIAARSGGGWCGARDRASSVRGVNLMRRAGWTDRRGQGYVKAT